VIHPASKNKPLERVPHRIVWGASLHRTQRLNRGRRRVIYLGDVKRVTIRKLGITLWYKKRCLLVATLSIFQKERFVLREKREVVLERIRNSTVEYIYFGCE
jgi:hypothetical protein